MVMAGSTEGQHNNLQVLSDAMSRWDSKSNRKKTTMMEAARKRGGCK